MLLVNKIKGKKEKKITSHLIYQLMISLCKITLPLKKEYGSSVYALSKKSLCVVKIVSRHKCWE